MTNLKKPRLHVLCSLGQEETVTHVESNIVKHCFTITKGIEIKGKPDVVYCQSYLSSIRELENFDGKIVLFVGGDPWYELTVLNKMTLTSRITSVMKRSYIACISKHIQKIVCNYLGSDKNVFSLNGLWGSTQTRHGIDPFSIQPKSDYSIGDRIKIYMSINMSVDRKYEGLLFFLEETKEYFETKYHGKVDLICSGKIKRQSDLVKKLHNEYDYFHFFYGGTDWYQMLSEADIFVHPSFFDGWPRVVAEAMCFGIPIVAYNLPFNKEVSENLLFAGKGQMGQMIDVALSNQNFREVCGKTLVKEALHKTDLNKDQFLKLISHVHEIGG